jgi:hypothetical protein
MRIVVNIIRKRLGDCGVVHLNCCLCYRSFVSGSGSKLDEVYPGLINILNQCQTVPEDRGQRCVNEANVVGNLLEE